MVKNIVTAKELSNILDEWVGIINEHIFDGWLPETIIEIEKVDWDDADGPRPVSSVAQHEGDSINTYDVFLDPDYVMGLGSVWEPIAFMLHQLVRAWEIEHGFACCLCHSDEFFYKALSVGLWFDEKEAADVAIIDPLVALFEQRGFKESLGTVLDGAKVYGMRGELVYEGRYVLTEHGRKTGLLA